MTPAETLTVPAGGCPSDEDMRAFLDGISPLGARIEAHVDRCEPCRVRLELLTGANTVVRRFITPPPPPLLAPPVEATKPTEVVGTDALQRAPVAASPFPAVPNYDIEAEIGRGGMGVVFRAHHRRLNRTVAVKMVLAGGIADPRSTQRFLFEAEVLARIQHPQVVQVYEVNLFTGPTGVAIPYLAMELLADGSLATWMATAKPTVREATALVRDLARAVHAAHLQGIIHRDLKPGNILRGPDGTFKVTDFGLAKMIQATAGNFTATGMVVGTPAYMAPEQAAGERVIGPAADVYALGTILYELLAGVPPFSGEDPMSVVLRVIREQPTDVRSLRRELPRELAAVVMKCLRKEQQRRYGSADELANDLSRFLDGRPTRARSHTVRERTWYWAKRNPTVAALSALLFAVVLAGFLAILHFWGEADRNAGRMVLARERADKLTDEAQRQGARLAFERAVSRCEAGQLADGLRGMVSALQLAEQAGWDELARVIRVNIAGWHRRLYVATDKFPAEAGAQFSFDRTGRWLVRLDQSGVTAFDAEQGKELARLSSEWLPKQWQYWARKVPPVTAFLPARTTFWTAAVSDDGVWVAAGSDVGTVVIQDRRTGENRLLRVRTKQESTPDVWCVRFTPSGTLWVVGSNGLMEEYDPRSGKRLRQAHPSDPNPVASARAPGNTSVQSLTVSHDGKRMFTGDRYGRVLEWDLTANEPKEVAVRQLSGWVTHLAISPDGLKVGATGPCMLARFWTVSPGADPDQFFEVSLRGNVGVGVCFSHDSQTAAVADGGVIHQWDLRTGYPIGVPIRGRQCVHRPGHPQLLVADSDGGFLLATHPLDTLAVPSATHWGVHQLDFHPASGEVLIASDIASTVDAKTGELRRRLPTQRPVRAGVFLSDGSEVILGLSGGWQVGDGPYKPTQYRSFINAFRDARADRFWVRTADHLECWSKDGSVRHASARLPSHGPCRLIPEAGELLLAERGIIRTSDASNGDIRGTALVTHDEILDFFPTRDGKFILTGHRDGTVQLWDRSARHALYGDPLRHNLSVSSLAWLPGEQAFASASLDGVTQVCDRTTGLPLTPPWRCTDAVSRIAAAPTTNLLAIGTSGGRVILVRYDLAAETGTAADLQRRYAQSRGCVLDSTAREVANR